MSKEAKILIGVAAVVVAGGVLLAIFANPQPEQPGQSSDPQSILRDTSHMTGKKDAKVTIVEFGDFQCPACGAAFPIVEQVLAGYKDNPEVNFAFRNFPLETIHPNARIGSEAAEAAGDQGKFWEMYRKLYEKQGEWSTQPAPLDKLVGYASEIGLDTGKFRSYVEQHLAKDIIDADINDAEKLTVNSTPTFFINGEIIRKVLTADEMKAKIDAALAK
jgi:protein-disulfide isomerase